MAQSVESTVNIKATADTSDVNKKLDQLMQTARQMAEEFRKANIASADFSGSIDRLSNGYSALEDSTKDVSKNIDSIGEESQESTVDINALSKALGSLANGGKVNADTFTKLAEALGMSGGELVAVGAAAGAAIYGIKLLADNTKEMISTFKNVGSAIGESAFQGIQWFVDSLEDMAQLLDECIDKLQEFADMGIEIQNSYIGLGNFIGTDAIAGLDEYANALENIVGLDATGIISDMSKLGGAIAELGATSEQAESVSKSLYELALNLHGFNPSTSTTQAIEGITKALQTGKIDYRTNKALFSLLGSDGVKQFNNLGDAVERYNFLMQNSTAIHDAYQRYLETDAGKIEILRQQYSSFMGNIGQIALHLYAVVAPILTQILQLANGVLGALMKLFNINVKTPTGAGGASGLGGLKKDIDDVGKSAGKATKQLASFDDVIQINDSKSSGSGIGDVDLGGIEGFESILPELIDESKELEDIWAHFKELIEEGDWLGAGKEFIKVLADQLSKIPWDDIKAKASEAGIAISDFLNGLFSTDLDGTIAWKTIGETIGEALNTIITFADDFLTNLHFNDIGKSLGTAWTALWETLDTDKAGHALYEAFTGVFQLALGFLRNGGLNKAATALAEIITSFFSSFTNADLDGITTTVEGIINDIINSLETVVSALTSDDVKRVVFGLIERIVTSFKDNAGEWGTALHDIANDILDFIIEGINTADSAGLDEAVVTFLSNLKLGELVSKYMQIKWELWAFEFRTKATAFFSMVLGFIWKALKDLVAVLVAIIAEVLLLVGQFTVWLFGACVGLGERIANWLIESTAKLGQTIGTFLGNIIGDIAVWGIELWDKIEDIGAGIGEKFEAVGETIESIFSGIWDFISGIFDPQNWINLGTAAINALWDAIKSIWNSTIGSLSLDIPGFGEWDGIHVSVPKLATGGIVTGATNAIIGEAGAEAVLPLENNTQWMDKLAAKINSSGGNAGGTIRVQLADKPFYTRAEMYEFGSLVVESLKAYGLNIAMV